MSRKQKLKITGLRTVQKIFCLVDTKKILENAAFYITSPCVFLTVARHLSCRVSERDIENYKSSPVDHVPYNSRTGRIFQITTSINLGCMVYKKRN